MIKVFVSWSGGKDCTYAAHKYALEHGRDSIHSLLHMVRKSSAHGYDASMIAEQAAAMGLDLRCQTVGEDGYEAAFKAALRQYTSEGITHGVFGDIYLDEHRSWLERVCGEVGVTPLFPLWGMTTLEVMAGFLHDGYKTIVVAIHREKAPIDFLGKIIDRPFLDDFAKLDNVDLCGENGEYHSFVFDGPLFTREACYEIKEVRAEKKHYILALQVRTC